MSVPHWVQDAIFYQIFPDRFNNGDPNNDPVLVQAWGEKPTIWDFQGGDLQGVIQKFDYLMDLGINALYFNPIFESASNHRYNTGDYFKIDPKLGTMQDFKEVLEGAHARGMRLILDGVFNHCGRGFFAFNDVLENQEHSSYCDWFHIKQFPLDAYGPGEAKNYQAWWNFKSLPKFNTDNPQVRSYIFDVARYWIDQGIDGWRLDVPSEIDDDEFWAEFRQVVKQANPEAYLVGEIWKIEPRWAGPQHFDGLMNYPLRESLLALVQEQKIDATKFAEEVRTLFAAYPAENSYAHYVPLGSHDTPRLATILQGDQRKIKLFYQVLFSYPGAPAIYYGDEVGLEGGEDPDSRRAFPWDENAWDQDLRNFIKQLIRLRRDYGVLRQGDLRFISCEPEKAVAMVRSASDSVVLLVFNPTDQSLDLRFPVESVGWSETQIVRDLTNHEQHVVSEGKISLHLTPYQGIFLHGEASTS